MEIFCCHFIDKESRYAGDIEIGRDEKIYKKYMTLYLVQG